MDLLDSAITLNRVTLGVPVLLLGFEFPFLDLVDSALIAISATVGVSVLGFQFPFLDPKDSAVTLTYATVGVPVLGF